MFRADPFKKLGGRGSGVYDGNLIMGGVLVRQIYPGGKGPSKIEPGGGRSKISSGPPLP